MKKHIFSTLTIIALTAFTGCSGGSVPGTAVSSTSTADITPYDYNGAYTNSATDASFSQDDYDYEIIGELARSDEYDVDLTMLTSTMVYAEVYDIMYGSSDSYLGKSMRMKGAFDIYTDYYTKNEYTYCVIADALGCCAQGIEFIMPDDTDMPELGTEIEVSGVFESYQEDGNTFYRLKDTVVKF